MSVGLRNVLIGTFTLRFSTGLTGAMLVYYLANLPKHGGEPVSAFLVGVLSAAFFAAELILAPPFGVLSDRLGHHRVMQFGPAFGAVAVLITAATTNIPLLGATRLLEGASTAASVPSILGYIALVTASDELIRGRASARFEGATLAGLGVGLVAAGPLFEVFGRLAFVLNAFVYGGSFLIYRLGVDEPVGDVAEAPARYGWRRWWTIVSSSHVLLLAPTWIAINAALGLWTSQSLFQFVRKPDERFAGQFLMGGFGPIEVSLGLAVGLVVFFLGLAYWGERFKRYRRTTIVFYGILGGGLVVVAGGLLNHTPGDMFPVRVLWGFGVSAGLFVLAGATPAALGLLADISEAYPADRGAIMGLYNVFLAIGQITGSLVGGVAAQVRGIDGLFVATVGLLVIALLPLYRLRAFEHVVGTAAEGVR